MGEPTVSNAEKSIVTRDTPHVAVATEPDVCGVPPKPTYKPFPNLVEAKKLGKGATTTVFIYGNPVLTAVGVLGPPSEPAHDGKKGGINNGSYRGDARPSSYSQDLFMEGSAVVREGDSTTQNNDPGGTPNCHGVIVHPKPIPPINRSTIGSPAFSNYPVKPILCTPARVEMAKSSAGRARLLMENYPPDVALELTIAARANVTEDGTLLYEWRPGDARDCDTARRMAAQSVVARDIMHHLLCMKRPLSGDEMRDIDHHLNNTVPHSTLPYDGKWPTPSNLRNALTRGVLAATQVGITAGYSGWKWYDQTFWRGTGTSSSELFTKHVYRRANLDFNAPNASEASWGEVSAGLWGIWDGLAMPDRWYPTSGNYPQTYQLVNAGVLPQGFDAITDFYSVTDRNPYAPARAARSVTGFVNEDGSKAAC